jgi:thiosulfate reductase cytochrome b subunit
MRSTSTKASPITTNRWFKLVWIIPVALVLLLAVVLIAQWLRRLPAVQSFMTDFPGKSHLSAGAPVGFPAWLGWQHFLNTLVIVLIIRSGWMVRTNQRPAAYWTRNNNSVIRTRNPPTKISLDLWFHLILDVLWLVNGIVFYVLIFTTGQWVRLVPTSWDVFPNAVSTAIQYASLNWPTANGWVNYNSLQQLTYFTTVFIAAPLALITGIRMSGAWPGKTKKLNKLYPLEVARAVHYPVMFYFVLFITVHVTLIVATGALRNLNHMYAVRDDTSWIGFWIFAAALVIMIAAWIAARPLFLHPIAALTGKLSRR